MLVPIAAAAEGRLGIIQVNDLQAFQADKRLKLGPERTVGIPFAQRVSGTIEMCRIDAHTHPGTALGMRDEPGQVLQA